MVLHALHLCSGYGGFELALRHAGIDTRTVAHVERDAYAASVLVARMAGADLDHAPVWSDINTFDPRPWRGRVDIVTAGFPCQPFSAAGRRGGVDDDRWLWPAIARVISEVRPGYVILENVRGVVRAGLTHVLADLADLGFDAEWALLSASAVGAPHKRERWWCLAYPNGDGRQSIGVDATDDGHAQAGRDADRPGGSNVGDAGREGRPEVASRTPRDEGTHGGWTHGADEPDRASQDVADPQRTGSQGRRPAGQTRGQGAADRGEVVGHTSSERRGSRVGPDPHQQASRFADAQVAGHRFPPRPDDADAWQGWTGAQPSIHRGTDGSTDWLADALHLGGNGLVPQCASAAILALARRAGLTL